jgi:hypothetical protein
MLTFHGATDQRSEAGVRFTTDNQNESEHAERNQYFMLVTSYRITGTCIDNDAQDAAYLPQYIITIGNCRKQNNKSRRAGE